MKNLLFLILVFYTISDSNCQNNKIQTRDVPNTIINMMYDYFNEVLIYNYGKKDEKILFENFLLDYYNSWLKTNENSRWVFLEINNKQKLMSINKTLFVRDTLHYYYFYPEIILKNENFQQNKNPTISKETVYIQRIWANDSCLIYPNFYEEHNILFSHGDRYSNKLKGENFKTFEYIDFLINIVGEVSFFNLATFLTQTDSKSEIQFKEVREAIVVVFWKFICLQAGVDFYYNPSIETM